MGIHYLYCMYASVFFMISANSFCMELNLETLAQDFVLETKQLIIKEHPHAFNPSIIRWNNKLLMSFRVIPDPKHSFNSWIGLTWLDEKFTPVGKPQPLLLRNPSTKVPSRIDDARLFAIGEDLYLVYSDNEDRTITRGGFRMYIARLECNGKVFLIKNIERLSSFEDNNLDRREKNWVPFNYQDSMLLAYSLQPHRILQPIVGTGHCNTFVSSDNLIPWEWGELRGGTTALLDDGQYLAFFHSSKQMTTAHSQGKENLHYFMGAYTFQSKPPFAITRVSKEPIIGKNFYNGTEYKPYWKPVRVVFPCGFIFDDQYIWISYGRQDHEIWVAKLDKKKLYASLSSVSSFS